MRIRGVVAFCIAGALLAGYVVVGCGKKTETSRESPATEQGKAKKDDRIGAVCIFDGTALKQDPAKDGKWIASISLGESLTWLRDSSVDQSDKNRLYQKVQLSDGKQGWAASYGLVVNAQFGAIKEDAPVYKRPDVLTGTEAQVEFMSPVAIVQEKDEWIEFIGENRKKTGWLKKDIVTRDQKDVAIAVLASKKLKQKGGKDPQAALKAFVETSPYPESFFITKLKEKLSHQSSADTAMKDVNATAGQPASDVTGKNE